MVLICEAFYYETVVSVSSGLLNGVVVCLWQILQSCLEKFSKKLSVTLLAQEVKSVTHITPFYRS